MSGPDVEKEREILSMVKRVLTDVARDTHVKPGLRHPLSDNTILGIRDCLALISAREGEIAEELKLGRKMRPRFIDEPSTTAVVSLDKLRKTPPSDSE